jgi:phosphate transport system substrate-binding protein
VQWPAGVSAEYNEGVAALVEQTPNSIGYVELIYAIQHKLSFGAVRNSAGRYIQADLPSLTAAAGGMTIPKGSDFRLSITNAPGKDAYPIATFTWWLVPREIEDAGKRSALHETLRWILTAGQKQCSMLGYAPLPPAMAQSELQALEATK